MNDVRRKPPVLLVNCPPRRVHYLLTAKWTSMVLYLLHYGAQRTGEIQRCLPGISQKMLTQTLRELEQGGLVDRTVLAVMPPAVSYSLTSLGQTFVEPLLTLYAWAREHDADLAEFEANRAIVRDNDTPS